jgi:hypothetical protein
MKNSRSNKEVLQIIVASWNLHMAEMNAICAKMDGKYDSRLMELISFISKEPVVPSEVFLSDDEYTNQSIEHYNRFRELSKGIKFTRWKSLSKNHLVKTFGAHFDLYVSFNYNTIFLKYVPFFKMSERQFAKLFIKIKWVIDGKTRLRT